MIIWLWNVTENSNALIYRRLNGGLCVSLRKRIEMPKRFAYHNKIKSIE